MVEQLLGLVGDTLPDIFTAISIHRKRNFRHSEATTTTSFICMTIQAHTVLQKLLLGIKITSQGNYVTLIIICHEHQNKLKYIL